MKKIAINGFGRIGRTAFKIALTKKNLSVAAINDLTDTKTLAYLLKYDSVYGRYDKKVSYDVNNLIVNGKKYPVYAEKNPLKLPWKKLGVEVVLECTGVFETKAEMQMHLKAGAKKVLLSTPAKDEMQTLVFGTELTRKTLGKNENIVSNASCTTNSIAPVIQVLESKFGIEKSLMTTIHAYTASQRLIDGPEAKDLRRGRAGAVNMVLSTTCAAKATALVIPELKDKFDGIAVRVPIICGSLSDITAVLKKEVSAETINKAFIAASKQPLYKGIIGVTGTDDELVSTDIIGTTYSAIIDLKFTRAMGNLAKVLVWYDNEWGYSHRLVEMAMAI